MRRALLCLALLVPLQGCTTCFVWGVEPPDVFGTYDPPELLAAVLTGDGALHVQVRRDGDEWHLSTGDHPPTELWPRGAGSGTPPLLAFDSDPWPEGAPLHAEARPDPALTSLLGAAAPDRVEIDAGVVVRVGPDGARRPAARLPEDWTSEPPRPPADGPEVLRSAALTPLTASFDVLLVSGAVVVLVFVGPILLLERFGRWLRGGA